MTLQFFNYQLYVYAYFTQVRCCSYPHFLSIENCLKLRVKKNLILQKSEEETIKQKKYKFERSIVSFSKWNNFYTNKENLSLTHNFSQTKFLQNICREIPRTMFYTYLNKNVKWNIIKS